MSGISRDEDEAWRRAMDTLEGSEWADQDLLAGKADVIAQLVRDVQRETAEECLSLGTMDAIRDHFNLKESK